MNKNIKMAMFMILILGLILILLFIFIRKNLTLIKSDIDEKYYYVQNKPNKKNASNLLADIKIKMDTLCTYLIENIDKYPNYSHYILELYTKTRNTVIKENTDQNKYTSYSVNKGEKIVFCLRSKETGELHDINILTYVLIHELAHVACPEYDHTPLFVEIFKFLLQKSQEIGIYQKINFKDENVKYCGIDIQSSI